VSGGYKNCPMIFLNIPNIHEVRAAHDRLREVTGVQTTLPLPPAPRSASPVPTRVRGACCRGPDLRGAGFAQHPLAGGAASDKVARPHPTAPCIRLEFRRMVSATKAYLLTCLYTPPGVDPV